ncbi:MAG: succinate dehydrogenase assembly factor 2 [Alphaproteobacteria bacterium]
MFRAWRRGFREADLILGPFAENHVRSFTEPEFEAFGALLDQDDHDVYNWINGKTPPPAEYDTPILARLRVFHLALPVASGDISGS